KAFVTSNLWRGHPSFAAIEKRTLIVSILATVPSGLYFIVKIQRHPTVFLPWGRIHLSIVSFLLNASIYVFIASLQTLDSKACLTKVGISSKYREVLKIWASGDKFPLAMFAIGYLDLRASFSGVYLYWGTPLLVLEGSSYLTDDSGDSLFSYVSQSMFASERVGETVRMERSSFVVLFPGSVDCGSDV
nr:hypothetical protein [Tanacetum cinerariifolium]